MLLILVCSFCAQLLHAKEAVRSVDFSEAPEMKELAERARRLGNEVYPKILGLLTDDASRLPAQFDIIFKKHGADLAVTSGQKIYVSAEWFTSSPTNLEWEAKSPANLEMVLVHEMVHVTQRFRSKVPFYWGEGMADYVRYKLGYTNGWSCPQCSEEYPHYTSGYWCAGAFLLYVDATYGSNIVRQFNRELERGKYSEKFFPKQRPRAYRICGRNFSKLPRLRQRRPA